MTTTRARRAEARRAADPRRRLSRAIGCFTASACAVLASACTVEPTAILPAPTPPIAVGVSWERHEGPLRVLDTPLYARSTPIPLSQLGKVDRRGVAVYVRGGRRHYHPVVLTQHSLKALDGYASTRDPAYLERARANVTALLQRAHRTDDGTFFPYTFDFPLHRNQKNKLSAPWWSAMAQGKALSSLIGLYEATGEERWLDAARRVYATLAAVHPADELASLDAPWVSFVDDDGYLWFEEYAGDVEPMRVLNGHIFAIYGLYDYWRVTHDGGAKDLIDGALATVVRYLPDLRSPGRPSWYGMRIRDIPAAQSPHYHRVHIAQLRRLGDMTGDPVFGRFADELASDFG